MMIRCIMSGIEPQIISRKSKVENRYWIGRIVQISFILLILLSSFVIISKQSVFATAGINRTINFQGKIVNKTSTTNIPNNSYNFTFKLYDAASGGNQLPTGTPWEETQSISVTNGIFQATLGSSTPIPAALDFNDDSIYLDVIFDGETFTTRVRLTAVPYAFNAQKVSGLTVTNTTGTLTIPNGKTIQFADAFTTSGAFPLTLTVSNTTNATLPTGSITLVDLATSQSLTNKTIGSTGLVFSGADIDISTISNENFSIVPNGSGKVGIGTTTISEMLTVFGNATSSGNITMGGQLQVGRFNADPATVGMGSIYYNTADNKFRCYINSAWADCDTTGGPGGGSNYWSLSTVNGTISPMNTTTDLLLGSTATSSARMAFTNIFSGNPTASLAGNLALTSPTGANPTTTYDILNGGSYNLQTSVGGDAGLTSRLFINNLGNVGIGTTNPGAKLDVNGNITIQANGTIDTSAAGSLTIGGSTQNQLILGRAAVTTSLIGSNITLGGIAWGGSSNTLSFTAALTGILQANNTSAPTAITGNNNTLAKWSTSAPYLTNSNITDDGSTVTIGGGTGDIRLSLSSEADVMIASKVATLTTSYVLNDFLFQRDITGTTQTQGGSVLKVLNTSESDGGVVNNPDMILVNTIPASGVFTGNLLRLQNNSVDKFNVDYLGNATASGNITMGGQLQVGRFNADPTTIGVGSMYYNTADNKFRCYINSAWADCDTTGGPGGGSNYWSLSTAGTISPMNTTVDLLLGGTATSSARMAFTNIFSGNPTASLAGNLSITSPTTANPATTYNVLNGGSYNLQTSVGGDADLTSRLYIANNGNVGIGTTGPSEKLHLSSSTATGLYIETTDSSAFDPFLEIHGAGSARGSEGFKLWYDNSAGSTYLDNQYSGGGTEGSLYFRTKTSTAPVNALTISPDGNVGIGATAPTEKLEIAGNATSSGNITMGGQLQVGRFNADPATVGMGSIYYNTADNKFRCYINSAWADCDTTGAPGSGENYWSLSTVNGTISPMNTTTDLLLGSTATSSARMAFTNIFSGNPTASLAGNLALTSPTGAEAATTYKVLNGGSFNLQTSVGGDAGLTSRLFINNLGNVGIGTTNPGALLQLASSTVGSTLFDIAFNGSSVFSVTDTGIINNLPTSFNSPGDVSIAYDLNFTNPSASYVKSASPLYIQAGEYFNSSDLNLMTYNKGNVIVTSEAFSVIGSATISAALNIGTNATVAGTFSLAPQVQQYAGVCNATSAGKMYYDTSQNSYYFCNASTWTQVGSGGGGGGTFSFLNGAMVPQNITTDLLIGGIATSSAKFAFTNIFSGTPTASFSGDLVLNSGARTIAGRSYNPLTIGDSQTGNLLLNPKGSLSGIVQIGTGSAGTNTPDLLGLDVKSDGADPVGFEGAIYYNTNTNKFRCYEGSAWANCIAGSLTDTDIITFMPWAPCASTGTTKCTISGAGCVAVTNMGAVGYLGGQFMVDMDTYNTVRLRYMGRVGGGQSGTQTVKLTNITDASDTVSTTFNSNETCTNRTSANTDISALTGVKVFGLQIGNSATADDPQLSGVVVEFTK